MMADRTGLDHEARVLVAVASRHGATSEIARTIGEVLAQRGLRITVAAPDEVRTIEGYDAVILGSAVYTGHWLDAAVGFVNRFGDVLATRPVWLFSTGPVGDPSRKLVQKMGEVPPDVAGMIAATRARGHRVFAGKLERRNLGLCQRAALALFPGLEGDFRDWAAIRAWAGEIADQLAVPALR